MLNGLSNKIAFPTDEVQNLRQSILQHLENESIERTYERLAEQESLFETNTYDMSYLRGGSGLVFVYLKTYEKIRDEILLEKSKKILLNNYSRFINSTYVDCSLYNGKSGLLLVTLMLYEKTKNKDLERSIGDIAKSIISDALLKGKNLVWYNHLQLVSEPLCSFGYGLSGIAYVLNFLNSFLRGNPLDNIINGIDNYIIDAIGEDVDYACDYRKDILNKEDLNLQTQKYVDGDIDFFKNATTDYSIENGWLGIVYYLIYKGLKSKTIFKNAKKKCDIVHLEKVLRSLQKSNTVEFTLENSSNLTACMDGLPTFEDVCFLLPVYEFSQSKQELKFLDDPIVAGIIFKNNYYKLFNYLAAKEIILKWGIKGYDDLEASIFEIDDEVIKTKALSIFEYENSYLKKRLDYLHNPYENISAILIEKKIIALIEISDSELLKKKLIFRREKEIKKCYSWNSNDEELSEKHYLWKFSTEKGLEEYPFNVLSFIVFRFKKPKSIKQVLLEMIVFCKFSTKKKLKTLIEYSNSKNKKDLIDRLPFLLIYQIRLLIKDQILEFENYNSTNENHKDKMIDFILKRIFNHDLS